MPVFSRNGLIKVCLICHVPFKCTRFKLIYQNVFCPPELLCRPDIKLTTDVILAPFHDNDILSPTDFCNQWLQFLIVPIISSRTRLYVHIIRLSANSFSLSLPRLWLCFSFHCHADAEIDPAGCNLLLLQALHLPCELPEQSGPST